MEKIGFGCVGTMASGVEARSFHFPLVDAGNGVRQSLAGAATQDSRAESQPRLAGKGPECLPCGMLARAQIGLDYGGDLRRNLEANKLIVTKAERKRQNAIMNSR